MKNSYSLILMAVILLLGNTSLYSQEKKDLEKTHYIFTESKILDSQYKVVYFCFSEVRDNDHQTEILNQLNALTEVKTVRIYKDLDQNIRCQMTTLRDITPEDIQPILKELQTDFLFNIVKKEGEEDSNKINFLK